MSHDSERLLESDRLEELLGEPAPQRPVVVVAYRRRKRPWVPVLITAQLAVLGSVYELHRREVERLRLRATVAQAELESLKEESESRKLEPPSQTGRRIRSSGAAPTSTAVVSNSGSDSTSTQGKDSSDTPSSATVTVGPARPGPAAAVKSETAPTPTLTAAPAPEGLGAKAELATHATRSPRTTGSSVAAGPIAASPVADPPPHRIIIEPATVLPGPEDGAAVLAEAGNEVQGAGADTAVAVADRDEAIVPGALDRPLPTREETEREIREEARRKQAESQKRVTQQREEVRDIRDEERQRFRNELRLILEEHGKEAGEWIADLSDRSGRDDDPVLHAKALAIIGTRGASQRTKVHHMRAIGVPESVILDYLANVLDKNLGARNGPRSRNDVWVQAGRLLLRYDWKPPGATTAPAPVGKPSAARRTVRPAANRAAEPARPGL